MKVNILVFGVTCLMSYVSVAKDNQAHYFSHLICDKEFKLESKPKTKTQTVELLNNVSLYLEQALAKAKLSESTITTNILCQTLEGQKYSGSKEEWVGFFQQGIDDLNKRKAKKLQLTVLNGKDKLYFQENSYEYIFEYELNEEKYFVKSLAVMDETLTRILTLSIGAPAKLIDKVNSDYQRIISTTYMAAE